MTGRAALTAASVGIAALMLCACAQPAKRPAAPTKAPVSTPRAEENTAVASLAALQAKMFEEWAATQRRFTSRTRAQAQLPFALKMPDSSLVPSPTVFYVRPGSKRLRTPTQATVMFGEQRLDTVYFIANRSKVKLDLKAQVSQFEDDYKTGVSKSDRVWQLVDVSGNEAMAIEPGINTGARADHRMAPGVVYWWDGGVHYVLYGTKGPDGTPLAELVQIAESMR